MSERDISDDPARRKVGQTAASGVLLMTDKCGCHGDGTNEAVNLRVSGWQMAVNHTHTEITPHYALSISPCFFYYTDIHNSVISLPSAPLPLLYHFRPHKASGIETFPGPHVLNHGRAGAGGDTHFGHR